MERKYPHTPWIWRGILSVWILWAGVLPLPSLAQDLTSSELYQRLERAVATKSWSVAILIIQELQLREPERQQELAVYQQQLQQLSLTDTPQNQKTPLPRTLLPSADRAPFDRETFIGKLKVLGATAKVSKTRVSRQYGDGQRTEVSSQGCYRTSYSPIVYEVTQPDEYEVTVSIQGPTGLPTQRVPIDIVIDNSIRATSEVLLGSAAVGRTSVTVSASQVSVPSSVTVTIPGGGRGSFVLKVPSASTVLSRRLVSTPGETSSSRPSYCY